MDDTEVAGPASNQTSHRHRLHRHAAAMVATTLVAALAQAGSVDFEPPTVAGPSR